MERWHIVFCSEVALKEIRALPEDLQAKFIRIQDLIERYGPFEVGMPYVKPLQNKLWEIRLKGSNRIARSIYGTKQGKRIVVLRTFIKKSQKTPKSELALAFKRFKEIENDRIL